MVPKTFGCERPDGDHKKVLEPLFRSDIMEADVQVVREGGANTLHYHTGQDGLFVVLGGRARFYDDEDEIIATLDEGEGIHIPRGFSYWFEKGDSEEPLHLLHVAAISETTADERIVVSPDRGGGSTTHVDGERARPIE